MVKDVSLRALIREGFPSVPTPVQKKKKVQPPLEMLPLPNSSPPNNVKDHPLSPSPVISPTSAPFTRVLKYISNGIYPRALLDPSGILCLFGLPSCPYRSRRRRRRSSSCVASLCQSFFRTVRDGVESIESDLRLRRLSQSSRQTQRNPPRRRQQQQWSSRP